MKKSQNMLFIIKQDITIKAVKYDCETNVKFSQLARNLMELQSKTFLQKELTQMNIHIHVLYFYDYVRRKLT
jgi:hypothetical protein